MGNPIDHQVLNAVSRFHGYDKEDLTLAREIATKVMETYGDLTEVEWKHWREHGPWNDHPSVQSALAAIRYVKAVKP